jgi:putative SOS response-associated peptidase YedK
MCGRIAQVARMDQFLLELQFLSEVANYYDREPIARFNVAPSTRVSLLRGGAEGLHIDAVRWGWAPFWAKGKRPDPINARVETVASGRFFKSLWPHGRALVPANGWYEWVKDPDDPKCKQPYFIQLKDQAPMFFAALAQVTPGLEPVDDDGFVIITDASDAGMVDIHDRRPVVLAPEQAREWLEADLPPARAEQLARTGGRPVADFEWYRVAKAVGNVRNQGPQLIEPIQAPTDEDPGVDEAG